MGPNISADRWHEGVVRMQLTQNLDELYDGLKDEILQAFNDNINFDGKGMFCLGLS